jgi:dehydrogenase/reductase SDR family member 1
VADVTDSARPLDGKIALVTGASRGVGRGIALALGGAGATVYLTARTMNEGSGPVSLPGSLESTAAEIAELGGKAIPCKCDHRLDSQVQKVTSRIDREQGQLDILVNNAWGGYEPIHRDEFYQGRFWERPTQEWDEVFDVGVRSCYVASSLAIPLMLKAPEALIVNISFYSFSHDHGRVVYQAAKLSVDKMTYDMARDLRGSKVSCVSLWPGYVRTEGVMRFDTPKTDTESPWYAGRAVVALASDVAVSNRSGQIQLVGELAREYGFVDEDGLQPEPMHQTERGKGLNKTAIERLRGLLK